LTSTAIPDLARGGPADLRSTVALKALMATTGLIMVLFLIAHMLGNLWVFAGREQFNDYAHHIRTVGAPMLPHKLLLWIIRIVLLASVVGHIFAAVTLWRRNVRAVGGAGKRYQTTRNRRGVQRSYASFTMRYGGVVILLFVVYHLLHLTANTIHPGGASDSPYDRVVNGFNEWWVVASYTVAMIAVGFHLAHGIWGASMTLGQNTSPERRRRLVGMATTISTLLVIGFLVPPFAILFGWTG
jgi:succinate dehydrogenase / fumarate reductase cytochrome b subunit